MLAFDPPTHYDTNTHTHKLLLNYLITLQEFYLTIVLLLGVTVTTIVGRPDGAPPEACSTITPVHPGGNTATGAVPYTVNISSLADGYMPGQNYTSKCCMIRNN